MTKVTDIEYASRWDVILGRDDAQENNKKTVEADQPDHACDIGSGDNSASSTGQVEDA